ncbi:hypothetical protein [Bacteroides sp.]|uniref:hypothetical protein n=1 Tax=Bacteroides sp. TaxID=29523 RepID=UPI0025C550A1|nr:hypothetical protein [Bacteroides sp.]
MTFAKINEKTNYPGESRTKEQENSKALSFLIAAQGFPPIFIQVLNDFIQVSISDVFMPKVPYLN